MTSVGDSVATDRWLVPILTDLLPKSSLDALEGTVGASYWRAAVDKALLTDEEVLEALSTRTRFRIATDLLVSTQACDKVPEWLGAHAADRVARQAVSRAWMADRVAGFGGGRVV